MAGLPELGTEVRADSFQVQRVSAQSPEAEQIFRTAERAQAFADQAGARAEREMQQYGEDVGQATIVYEQQPDGSTRLRPLDQLLAWNVGGGNRAYNAAVMRNYGAAVETDARATFGRFQAQHANNPELFAAAARTYVDETTQAMPERVRGMVNTQLNVLATSFGTALQERVHRVAQDQRYSTAITGTVDLHRDVANLAAAGQVERSGEQLQRLNQRLNDIATEFPDRLNQAQIGTLMREARVDVTASTLSNQALQAMRRGGILAAEAVAARWAEHGTYSHHPATGRPIARNADGTARAEPGAPAVAMQHTPEERQIIIQRALYTARAQHQRNQLGRSLADQAATDAASDNIAAYNRAIQSPHIRTPEDRALAAQQIQAGITDPRAQDRFIAAVTNPALAAERSAREALEAREERAAAGAAIQAERAASAFEAARIVEGRIIQSTLPRGDAGGLERVAGEQALRAATQGSQDRSQMSDEQAQLQPPQPFNQEAYNRVYGALIGPSQAITAARAQAEETALAQLTVLDMQHQVDAAAAGQQPIPYRHIEMMRTLPPEQWPAAARLIDQQHKAQLEQIAEVNAATREVAARGADGQGPPASQNAVDTMVNNSPLDPNNPQLRGVPVLDSATEAGQRNIARVVDIAQRAGTIPTLVMRQIDVGFSPTANFASVENANYIAAALLANPIARPQMEHLLGDRMLKIDDNATEIAIIRRSPNNETEGQPDPAKMETAWQRVQERRRAGAAMSATDIEAVNRRVLDTTDVGAAQSARLQAAVAGTQTEQINPRGAVWAAYNPLLAVVLSPFLDMRRVPGTTGTGSPSTPSFLQGSLGNVFNSFMLFGESTVPIASDIGSIPAGMRQRYEQGWNLGVTRGMRDPAQLDAIGRQAVNLQYGPSVLGTADRNSARMTYYGLESTGRRLYNLEPTDVAAQLAQAYERHVAAGEQVRTTSGLEAVQNGDAYAVFIRGTESNPRWTIMARRPDRNGIPQAHEELLRIPDAQAPGTTYGARDQAVFTLRPNAANAAEQVREVELNRQATQFVTQNYPDLPTGLHSAVIGLTRMQMRLGLDPYSPVEGAARVERAHRARAAERAAPVPPPAAPGATAPAAAAAAASALPAPGPAGVPIPPRP